MMQWRPRSVLYGRVPPRCFIYWRCLNCEKNSTNCWVCESERLCFWKASAEERQVVKFKKKKKSHQYKTAFFNHLFKGNLCFDSLKECTSVQFLHTHFFSFQQKVMCSILIEYWFHNCMWCLVIDSPECSWDMRQPCAQLTIIGDRRPLYCGNSHSRS